ncbi:energy-coupling factor transporter transmembrane component T family protein [Microbacterium binotii]|uniref:energy-coupling factor transporter transmembrane component T family protein n=1 Tax=Microbacterium binotii TaxID=462710 RepID=UPI001F441C0E|nr:energy-coupling factor transporter transmembrane protein EcfT [Microbacterium binotii]UIN29625.1 energy-coupling factor transporter transmembrane protein EcfT [Microbacterium binotii]
MLSLYRPGTGPWHRMPAGRKTLLLLALVLGVSLLPATWLSCAVAAALVLLCYATPGAGWAQLGRQIWSLRLLVLMSFLGQAIFLGLETATIGTVRITAAIVLAALLALTTPVTALWEVFERALSPLRVIGRDPRRAALLLVVAFGAVPTLIRLAQQVREAQRARGAGRSIRAFAVPYLVLALKHADELGDALTARGVR